MYNKQLLTKNNHKTIKGEKLGYITHILYLSSYTNNSFGKNVCSHASKGCAESCLVSSGFGGIYNSVQEARRLKTEYFLKDRKAFLIQLNNEINKIKLKYKDKAIITFRLNGTSDIAWEKFKIFEGKNIFEIHSDVQFYDYTKNYLRFTDKLPSNYHLTFSRSEDNHAKAIELLNKGYNVSMVFNTVPETYEGYKVINGDETDLTFLYPKGVIVGLKYKNVTGKNGGEKNKAAFESGFAIRL